MPPSSAARFRDGVEASPMDAILALNGFDLNELFNKTLPEPPPLVGLDSSSDSANTVEGRSKITDALSAVESLGLSADALNMLGSLLGTAILPPLVQLSDPIFQLLLNNPGISNTSDLLLQLGELYRLVGDTPLPSGKDLSDIFIDLMKALDTNDSLVLLMSLRANPLLLSEALADPITGISSYLGNMYKILRVSNAFANDPIIGSIESEILLAGREGGTRLIGGGGSDFYVIPLNSKPFIQQVIIEDLIPASGSKIILDITQYSGIPAHLSFKTAKNSRRVNKLARSKTVFIFNSETHELLLNGNGRKSGLGQTGGSILFLQNESIIGADNLLIFDNNLRELGGASFIG